MLNEHRIFSPSLLFVLWLIALPVLLVGNGRPEVSRTQEARVLEVARQMLGRPGIDWIIPKLNGDLRLQKPPVTYWMTALAYKVGGVSEGVGRVPTTLLAWLTLAVVYCAARWLFGPVCGLMSAACLLGSYYFARFSRLAETDPPATLFVTLAIYALWRGSESRRFSSEGFERIARPGAVWMHLGAAATALSIVCKGLPGIYPILFLIGYSLTERTLHPFKRLLFTGAILTFAIIAAPWFLYVGHHEGWKTFFFELKNVEAGTDHGAPITQYIPWLAVGTLPWGIVSLIAVIKSFIRLHDSRLKGLLVWLGAIAAPLCFARNKQTQYLLPLMPVLMIFAGWQIDRWGSKILFALALAAAAVLPPAVTMLFPKYVPQHTRETADFVRRNYDGRPLCFFGDNESVPLCFNLKRAIPFVRSESALTDLLKRSPGLIVITIGKDKRPAIPPADVRSNNIQKFNYDDQTWTFYDTAAK